MPILMIDAQSNVFEFAIIKLPGLINLIEVKLKCEIINNVHRSSVHLHWIIE